MILIFQYHDDYFCVKFGFEFFASDWVFKLSQSDAFRPISIPENFFSQNFSYLKKSRRFLPPFRAGASEVHFLEPKKVFKLLSLYSQLPIYRTHEKVQS